MSINKAPFRSSNIRFDKSPELLAPGPGAYEPRLNVICYIIMKIMMKITTNLVNRQKWAFFILINSKRLTYRFFTNS